MKSVKFYFPLFVILLWSNGVLAQDTIFLKNSSFEDIPRKGVQGMPGIKGWTDCGSIIFPGESPPDIHPIPKGAWGVDMKPMDGNTYLGLVIRESFTWEYVSQKLNTIIKGGSCYSFAVHLGSSSTHQSATIKSVRLQNNSNRTQKVATESFVAPVVIRIWGGQNECEKIELLAESIPIQHQDWIKYEYVLSPNRDYGFITLEAYYNSAVEKPYNGHIMVDGLSPIIEVKCE